MSAEACRHLLQTVSWPAMTRPPRLSRLATVFAREPIYFVTACTAARCRVLADEAIHRSVVTFAVAGNERGAFVGRYVIMPDHIHLFVMINPEAMTLSAWMKSLKNHLSKQLRSQGVPAPHWQKGFFDHVLRSGESYEEKWQYVLQNPVRAGLVSKPEDWLYQGEVNALEYRRS
jgi:REP element-mobilizing transposase RayT